MTAVKNRGNQPKRRLNPEINFDFYFSSFILRFLATLCFTSSQPLSISLCRSVFHHGHVKRPASGFDCEPWRFSKYFMKVSESGYVCSSLFIYYPFHAALYLAQKQTQGDFPQLWTASAAACPYAACPPS